jgi:hypothetical protein
MSRNDAAELAARLYARVPGHYRVSDAEQGYPLRALLAVVGEQVSALRTNLDDLWDDFFIETCDERIVPYLGALVGTKLLQRPVGQSNRLDVWNTVAWRRSKGTPRMLGELARSISGWPAEVDEFFGSLAWSEHLRHVRTARTLTADLKDEARLALLGTARDPFAHAADLRPAAPLDSARVTAASLGVPVAAFGTHGRYAIDRLGVFVDRLAVHPIRGATPAPEIPASSPLAPPRCFTFDPLFHDRPLFSTVTGGPISRRAFAAAPWTFAADTAVRAHGVALVDDTEPAEQALTDGVPLDFGGRAAPFGLTAMRIADVDAFAGAAPFVVRATWVDVADGTAELAALGTLRTRDAQRDGGTFVAGAPASSAGRLRIDVALAPGIARARFPGAILALRVTGAGSLRERDGAYVALPSRRIARGAPMTWWIDGAGASYTQPGLPADALARGGNGPVYPPRALTASTSRAASFLRLHRVAGLRLADPGRFAAGVNARYDARIDDLSNRALGAIAAPNWTYQPTPAAARGAIPSDDDLASGVLVIHVTGNASLPPAELIATNREGETLVVYLPEISPGDAAHGASFLVAEDGATYRVPPGAGDFTALAKTFGSLQPERRSAGAVLPIAGVWPLRRRAALGIHHRRREPRAGELGIDAENGRFRLAPGDPLVGSGIALGVDYGEALRDARGALGAYDAQDALDVVIPAGGARAPGAAPNPPDVDAVPTRVVAASGDAPQTAADDLSRVHRTLASAFAAATGTNETIEIADAATYAEPALVLTAPALRTLTLRAASGKRPAVVWRDPRAGLHVRTPLDRLSLIGVLATGAPVQLDARVGALHLLAVSLDPDGGTPALLANDVRVDSDAHVVVVRAITGPLLLGAGVQDLSVVDSVVGPPHAVAIGGLPTVESPPRFASPPHGVASPPQHLLERAQTVRLERATLFGAVHATVLHATDVLFAGHVDCADRTGGCVRYTRYVAGSLLPTRFRTTSAPAAFCSRRFGRVDYALLDVATDPAVRGASSYGAEPGVFAGARDATRADNLLTKLREFVPVRLVPVAIAQT